MTCSAATPILTEEEIQERPGPLKGWSRAENWIERRYEFKNFLRAMSFVNAIAYLAESMSHHPVINVRYNRVTGRTGRTPREASPNMTSRSLSRSKRWREPDEARRSDVRRTSQFVAIPNRFIRQKPTNWSLSDIVFEERPWD